MQHLELEPAPVAVAQAAVDRLGTGVGLLGLGRQHRQQPPSLVVVHQVVEAGADHLVGGVAQHAFDRRALVEHRAVGRDHGDQVARARHQRAEAGLALTAMQILRQRSALERQRDAGRERLQRCALAAGQVAGAGGQQHAARLVAHLQREHVRRARALREQQLVVDLLGQLGRGRDRGRQQQPLRGAAGEQGAAGQRQPDQLQLLAGQQAQPRRVAGAGQRARGRQRGRADVGPAGRADQGRARLPQRAFAFHRALLLHDQHRHARHDQQEQADRGGDHDQHVHAGILAAEQHLQAGGDQRGDREHAQPLPGQARLLLRHRLLERAHRRVQGRGAPEQVVGDPADVEQHLAVVGAVVQHHAVDEVGHEQRRDAAEQQVEGGLALAVVDRQAQRAGQQQDVGRGVGDRDDPGQLRLAVVVDHRRDQHQPRDQAEADRQDQRVDQRRPLAGRVSPPGEDEDAPEQRRVERQVDGVAPGREGHVRTEHARVDVRVRVAHREHELPDREQVPGPGRVRLVAAGAPDDRDRAGQADARHDEPVARDRRHEGVEQADQRAEGRIHHPQRRPAGAGGDGGHAARSWAAVPVCRNPRSARSVRARISRSISASVFAAVICTRKPTSSRGTSG